jgi:hypothetical protein
VSLRRKPESPATGQIPAFAGMTEKVTADKRKWTQMKMNFMVSQKNICVYLRPSAVQILYKDKTS